MTIALKRAAYSIGAPEDEVRTILALVLRDALLALRAAGSGAG